MKPNKISREFEWISIYWLLFFWLLQCKYFFLSLSIQILPSNEAKNNTLICVLYTTMAFASPLFSVIKKKSKSENNIFETVYNWTAKKSR